jgi:hypothetical protein
MIPSISIKYRGHGQSVFGLVVEPVHGAAEGLVKFAQVILQDKRKPKLLCGLERLQLSRPFAGCVERFARRWRGTSPRY